MCHGYFYKCTGPNNIIISPHIGGGIVQCFPNDTLWNLTTSGMTITRMNTVPWNTIIADIFVVSLVTRLS